MAAPLSCRPCRTSGLRRGPLPPAVPRICCTHLWQESGLADDRLIFTDFFPSAVHMQVHRPSAPSNPVPPGALQAPPRGVRSSGLVAVFRYCMPIQVKALADVALDTTSYNGHSTTMDVLWYAPLRFPAVHERHLRSWRELVFFGKRGGRRGEGRGGERMPEGRHGHRQLRTACDGPCRMQGWRAAGNAGHRSHGGTCCRCRVCALPLPSPSASTKAL
jgi:hypothetical protein